MSARLLLACLLGLVISLPAVARLRTVAPGSVPELDADEGLLLVAVDSSIALDSVRVRREGKLLSSGVLANIAQGQSLRLYVAPAGRYEWEGLRVFNRVRYDFSDDPEYRFEVRPGRITYGGDLVFRPSGLLDADVQVSNRGLRAIDWLQREHPALLQRYAFSYSGHYPDPFPAFYLAERGDKVAASEETDGRAAPAAGELPLAIDLLWREERIGEVALSPDGAFLVEQVREADAWGIDLIDLAAGTSVRLATTARGNAYVAWADAHTLLLGTGPQRGEQRLSALRIGTGEGSKRSFEVLKFPRDGRIVDTLPGQANEVLFASYSLRGKLLVHAADLSSQHALDQSAAIGRKALNQGVENDLAWFADGSGRLRAALARRDDRTVLMHGRGGTFTEVLDLSAPDSLDIQALSWDGNLIYGLSDADREQRDLVVFDPTSRRITRTLFSKPGVDVAAALFDERREPIGVAYYRGGRLVSEYFDAARDRLAEAMRKAFPGRAVLVIDRSQDGSQLILAVEGSNQPTRLYHLDVASHRATLLDSARPWLDAVPLVATERFTVAAAGGYTLDAYLTLPPGAGRRPLVVMPHGGPVGVNDRLEFDPEVQFIASLGYAVLQVNFRGSDGYGRAFREAGHHAHGTGIEDDIDAALEAALEKYPLDPARMCLVGSSYGGYSAVVSTLRRPGRFRCAVSISGVSDRLLFFTASDGGHSARGRAQLERVIGNPNTQQAELMATSPLYRYRELVTPLMLVHGAEDMRVDYEHTRRLARMLHLAGRTPVLLRFEDEAHGIVELDNVKLTWAGIAGFLRQHLATNAAPATGAPATAQAAPSSAPNS